MNIGFCGCLLNTDIHSTIKVIRHKSLRKRRRYSNCSNSSSDSGDEWIPALETSVMKKKPSDITRGNKLLN